MARSILQNKIDECIRQKEKLILSDDVNCSCDKTKKFHNALSLLMQHGKEKSLKGEQLTVEELKELCLELLFGGHTILSSATTSVIYYLAK